MCYKNSYDLASTSFNFVTAVHLCTKFQLCNVLSLAGNMGMKQYNGTEIGKNVEIEIEIKKDFTPHTFLQPELSCMIYTDQT